MAEEKFRVIWDIKNDGQGYDAIAAGTVVKKGKSLPGIEPAEKGLRGQVFAAKVCEVEAESAKEAVEIAEVLYGSRGGVGAAAKAANLAFESV